MSVMHFDSQAIRDIEFDHIRQLLSVYCVQPTARNRMSSLLPTSDLNVLLPDLKRVDEFLKIRSESVQFPAIDFEETGDELRILRAKDSTMGEEQFARIFKSCELSNEIIASFNGLESAFPELNSLLIATENTDEILNAIRAVFDNKWHVRDEASPELARIRSAIADIRRQINKNFSKALKEYSGKGFLGDNGESYLNERKVISVYSTHKRKVPGLVIGSSKTGNVTYIEPEINIPLNFELESLIDDERTEIRRILLQLTNHIRKFHPLLTSINDLLCELDFIQAKTRLALELNAILPIIGEEVLIDLKEAFHPILFLNNKKAGRKTFPQSIKMDKFARMLVISGPNAGGKSITMKTIGLLQVMLQSGLLVPVSHGSQMCFFQAILTDIGDNQSIENQLSTYSYRLKRMELFLRVANRRSLVLLDEFGTGSDPDLGGALAEVFFEELYNKKCFGVITTHYTNIKLKAAQLKNAVNGCMLFNRETLEPAYKLSIGEPGSSFTFEVAEINGIPTELIEKAKSKLDDQTVKMDKLLGSLQEEKTRLENLSENARQAAIHASSAILDFEQKKERYEEKLLRQQETIERNNKYLAQGKKMNGYIESYDLRSKNKELLEEIKKYIILEKSKLEDVRKQKMLKKKVEKTRTEAAEETRKKEAIKVGSLVRLEKTKQTGTVLELLNGQATVAFGVFKTKVDASKLEWIK